MKFASPPSQDLAVLNAIKRAAAAGRPCPTNDILAGIIGAGSVSTPARCIKRLERKGLISVQRGNSQRVVTVAATGQRTAGHIEHPHWRERRGMKEPVRRQYNSRLGASEREPAVPDDFVPVDRTPCFRCGVRGDLGCEHHRSAAL